MPKMNLNSSKRGPLSSPVPPAAPCGEGNFTDCKHRIVFSVGGPQKRQRFFLSDFQVLKTSR
jgi:hypothetical protein